MGMGGLVQLLIKKKKKEKLSAPVRLHELLKADKNLPALPHNNKRCEPFATVDLSILNLQPHTCSITLHQQTHSQKQEFGWIHALVSR